MLLRSRPSARNTLLFSQSVFTLAKSTTCLGELLHLLYELSR